MTNSAHRLLEVALAAVWLHSIAVVAQTAAKNGWSGRDYPNPLKQFDECGMKAPSNLCDPDDFLQTFAHRMTVQRTIEEQTKKLEMSGRVKLRSDAPPACDNVHNLELFVALVRKIEAMGGGNATDTDLIHFANAIASKWGLTAKPCRNFVIIILTLDSKLTFIHEGKHVLLPIDLVSSTFYQKSASFNREEYTAGLQYLIETFVDLLTATTTTSTTTTTITTTTTTTSTTTTTTTTSSATAATSTTASGPDVTFTIVIPGDETSPTTTTTTVTHIGSTEPTTTASTSATTRAENATSATVEPIPPQVQVAGAAEPFPWWLLIILLLLLLLVLTLCLAACALCVAQTRKRRIRQVDQGKIPLQAYDEASTMQRPVSLSLSASTPSDDQRPAAALENGMLHTPAVLMMAPAANGAYHSPAHSPTIRPPPLRKEEQQIVVDFNDEKRQQSAEPRAGQFQPIRLPPQVGEGRNQEPPTKDEDAHADRENTAAEPDRSAAPPVDYDEAGGESAVETSRRAKLMLNELVEHQQQEEATEAEGLPSPSTPVKEAKMKRLADHLENRDN